MATSFGQWQVYPGTDRASLALPDYYSTYLAYTIDTSQRPNTGLRITGDFPDARYMSFNVYATRLATSLGGLTDYQIATEARNINPFVAGNDAHSRHRQYVVNVEPESNGSSRQQTLSDSASPGNLLAFDPKDLLNPKIPKERPLLTVIIRYYVPKQGDCGGAGPPMIDLYEVSNPTSSSLAPDSIPMHMDVNEPIFRKRLAPIFQSVRGTDLRFYHSTGGGQFNNADNIYLISAVENVDGHNNVVILKLKPPTYPLTNDEFDRTAVRYWSFNQGNPDTSTPFGMKDEEFRPATDGFVYIVMGDESFRPKAKQGGYNFMPWKANKEQAVILYRNMLTNPQYRGSIARVALLPEAPWKESVLIADEASGYIGDYAPIGRKVTAQEFNETSGGMPSPGFAKT